MKRLFAFLTAAVICAAACTRIEIPAIEFAKLTGSIYTGTEKTAVVLKTNMKPEKDLTVKLHVSYIGTDLGEISSAEGAATFKTGETETVFEVMNRPEGIGAGTAVASIRITFAGFPEGCVAGGKIMCLLTPDTSEAMIYSFASTEANLYENLKVRVNLTGTVNGTDFRTNSAISFPAKISGEGAKYVTYGEFKAEAGSNSAVLELKLKEGGDLSAPIVITVDPEAEGLVAGDNSEMLCTVRGIPGAKNLAGTWKCTGLVDSEELPLELWFMEYEQDFDAAPVHGNENFELEIAFTGSGSGRSLGGDLTLKPAGSGEFGWYFREALMTPCEPKNQCPNPISLGRYSAEENNMFVSETYGVQQIFYYELSSANRLFAKDSEKLGKGCISISFLSNDEIVVSIQDYDLPTAFWTDESGFETEFNSFASIYKRQ